MCELCDSKVSCSCYCNDLELMAVEYRPYGQVHIAYCDNCKHEVRLWFYET